MRDKKLERLGIISNTFEDSLSFFNLETNLIINKLYLKSLDDNQLKSTFFYKKGIIGPFKMAYDFNRDLLYCVNKFDDSMTIIDVNVYKDIYTIPCGTYPTGITIDKKNAYVCNGDSDSISIIDLDNREIVSHISIGEMPIDIQYCDQENKVIAALYKANSIALMDVKNFEIEKMELNDLSPLGILVTKDIFIIYGFNNFNQKGRIELRNRRDLKIIDSFNVASMPLGVCVFGSNLYATDGENGRLVKINLSKRQIQYINIGGMPQCVCLETCNDNFYVTDSLNGKVVVLNHKDMSIKTKINSGKECSTMIIIEKQLDK